MIRFIHIKKNGGTSVYKFLRKNKIECLVGPASNMKTVYNQHISAKVYKNEDTWKFCVCRNPYTRTVSFFNWIKKNPKYNFLTFENFVINKYDEGRALGAWGLQLEYILDDDKTCLVDKIFRFENLEQDIKNHFQLDTKFPHLTKSTFDKYENYYNDELRNIVFEHYREDFEYFNYQKNF